MTEYTEGQLKLARDVMENFRETCPSGYWVDSLRVDESDGRLYIDESEGETVLQVTAEGVCAAFEKVASREYANLRRDLFKTIRDMWEAEDYLGEDGPGGDLETDDVLVQIAAFGSVVYG